MSHADTSIETLLRDAMPHAITDHATQCELVRQLQAGDARARDRLLLGSVGLVVRLVGRYRDAALSLGLEMADLVTAGLYGLPGARRTGMLRAVEKFDPGRGLRLSTYARYWIIDAAQQLLRRSSVVRSELRGQHYVGRGEMTDPEADTIDPEIALDMARDAASARAAMVLLTDQQRQVIDLAYGRHGLTVNEIAKRLKLTRARVRQLEADALLRLRCELQRSAA